MSVFIHGVMNTDNTAISGETIDYGPCAMMNHYSGKTVFSSIDKKSRYAFDQQAKIMHWNMARLADCLLPLVDDDEDMALAKLEPLIWQFSDDFKQGYREMMASKLGIADSNEADLELVTDLLAIMEEKKLDYTNSFGALAENLTQAAVDTLIESTDEEGKQVDSWQQWLTRWYVRISADVSGAKTLMEKTNPLVIPRNHHVERILANTQTSYQENGDLTALHDFLAVIQQPYSSLAKTRDYQDAPSDGDENYHTFCGT